MERTVVVLITAPTVRDAERLAAALVHERLAACVTVVRGVRSVYRWKGKMEKTSECLLIAKTTRRCLPSLTRRVKALHSYAVPEIVALPVQGGNASYLSWVSESVRLPPKKGVL